MYTERLVDSVVERARDVMTISCVTRGDFRVYRWRPPEVTRERQSTHVCCVLEGSGRICMSK